MLLLPGCSKCRGHDANGIYNLKVISFQPLAFATWIDEFHPRNKQAIVDFSLTPLLYQPPPVDLVFWTFQIFEYHPPCATTAGSPSIPKLVQHRLCPHHLLRGPP